jgi:LytS/YehU family sensor histidine kinase
MPRKKAQETLAEEMAHLKLKAFRAQMNPHFVFNALNAIQYFITSENKKSAVIYLSVFSRLIRFYLKHIEEDTVQLSEEIEMLHRYLKLQKLRYNDQFEYTITQDQELSTIDAKIPSFILQTVFENIIEHAIYNQYKNYTIAIGFKITKKRVHLEVGFTYNTSGIEKVTYAPDYRVQLIKWQDQIRLLNDFKNYSIKKKVTFNNNLTSKGGDIVLSLPNLS